MTPPASAVTRASLWRGKIYFTKGELETEQDLWGWVDQHLQPGTSVRCLGVWSTSEDRMCSAVHGVFRLGYDIITLEYIDVSPARCPRLAVSSV